MEIRPLRETDSRLEVSRIYEESWKFAYQGIVPQSYLDGIPAGRWADVLDRAGWDTLVLTEGGKLAGTSSVCPSRWPGWPGFGEVASSTQRSTSRKPCPASVSTAASSRALPYPRPMYSGSR